MKQQSRSLERSSAWFHALQKFREENRTAFDLNVVVSVDPSSAPRTSFDQADTTQTPRTRKRSVSSVPPSAAVTDGRGRSGEAQRKTKVARLSTRKSVPRVGSILWVDFAELRWTHDKIQRLFTCGRRLEDVVPDSCRGILLPSDLAHDSYRPLGEQVVLTQQWACSRSLAFGIHSSG